MDHDPTMIHECVYYIIIYYDETANESECVTNVYYNNMCNK